MTASQQTKQVKSLIGFPSSYMRDVRVRSDVAGTMISAPSQVVLQQISETLSGSGFDVIWLGNNMLNAARRA